MLLLVLPQAIKGASKDMLHVDGIATFCEMAVPLVSRLAEALGLPGNTPQAVDAARDKVRSTACLTVLLRHLVAPGGGLRV
jgi:hypothetical protein